MILTTAFHIPSIQHQQQHFLSISAFSINCEYIYFPLHPEIFCWKAIRVEYKVSKTSWAPSEKEGKTNHIKTSVLEEI